MHPLKICCWNINGIFRKTLNLSKLDDNDFCGSVSKFDIVGLVETHTGPDDVVSIPGYHTYQSNRPKAVKAARYSGGIAALVKSEISKGISVSQVGIFTLWLKLDKTFFGLHDNLYVCVTYLPPDNSTYSRKNEIDCVTILEEQVQHFSSIGNIIIVGDLNGRTSTNPDYIVDDTDKFIPDNNDRYGYAQKMEPRRVPK